MQRLFRRNNGDHVEIRLTSRDSNCEKEYQILLTLTYELFGIPRTTEEFIEKAAKERDSFIISSKTGTSHAARKCVTELHYFGADSLDSKVYPKDTASFALIVEQNRFLDLLDFSLQLFFK